MFFISCFLEIFKFLYWLFDYVGKQLDEKAMVNFKIFDVTHWIANNCNTHIAQYPKKQKQSGNGYSVRNIFFKNHASGRLVPELFLFFKKALYTHLLFLTVPKCRFWTFSIF